LKKPSKKKLAILTAVVISAFIGVFFWLNSENSGEIRLVSTNEAVSVTPEYKNYDSQNVSFEYLGKYTFQDLPATAGDKEVKKFTANTVYDKNISFIVSDLPGGKLENNSAYILRNTRTDLYKKRTVKYNGQDLTVWVNNNQKEQTVFITKGNQVAIFAFTQDLGDTIPDMTPEVDRLISSFEWK
jgi:uncharacterized protein YxeA